MRCGNAGAHWGKKNAAPIDSQSVKCADTVAAGSSGYDAGKKIKGRKRHILADAWGMLPGAVVTLASAQDRGTTKHPSTSP